MWTGKTDFDQPIDIMDIRMHPTKPWKIKIEFRLRIDLKNFYKSFEISYFHDLFKQNVKKEEGVFSRHIPGTGKILRFQVPESSVVSALDEILQATPLPYERK